MNAMMTLFTVFSMISTGLASDTCHYSKDGICDEPPLEGGCAVGTDTTDCMYEPFSPCEYINDGVCDEGPENQYCLPGTDTNDCCENGTLKVWNETDINFGRDLSDAVCEEFLLEYRKIMSISPNEEINPMTCSGALECRGLLQDEKVNESKRYEQNGQIISSLFLQMIFVYCSCIYYQRIIDGMEFIRDNIDIIFKIWCNILKCCIYLFLLIVCIGVVFSAIGDKEKEPALLKTLGFLAFLDYVDERENDRDGGRDEEDEYRRWRRRRDRYNE